MAGFLSNLQRHINEYHEKMHVKTVDMSVRRDDLKKHIEGVHES